MWPANAPAVLSPGTSLIVGWVGPRTGLDVEKRKFLTLPGLKIPTLRSFKSLYRLRYPGSLTHVNKGKISFVHSVQNQHGKKELDINDRYMKSGSGGKKSGVSLSESCPRLWRQQKGYRLHVGKPSL
jgi:hypothetical protein